MGGLETLPVELLRFIADHICADAIAVVEAATNAAIINAREDVLPAHPPWDADSDSDDDAGGNEVTDEVDDETDMSSEKCPSQVCSGYNGTATKCVRGGARDLAALALTNRYLHQVFDPILYKWAHDYDSYGIAWAISRNSLGTLEKALAMGLLDVNAYISPLVLHHEYEPIQAIEAALENGSEASLEWLLEHGANPDGEEVRDHPLRVTDYTSPLNQSDASEDASLLLLDHGARVVFVDQPSADDWSRGIETALHTAAMRGHARVVQRLLVDGTVKLDLQNSSGHTPLVSAASCYGDNTAVLELFMQHGADRADPEALAAALKGGHAENAMFLLCAHKDFSHSFLYDCLETLNVRLEKFGSGRYTEEYVSDILSRLVELGADFNYPRISPNCRRETLVMMAYERLDPFIYRTLTGLGANPLIRFGYKNGPINIITYSRARRVSKSPATGLTIFEEALGSYDLSGDCQYLRYLLTHGNLDNPSISHVHEVLESRIRNMEFSFQACIEIMQHGWISKNARSFVFDWLVSYMSGISSSSMVEGTVTFLETAARVFPTFLDRQQLDDLWGRGLSLLRSHGFDSPRVSSIPWWHINAERGDSEAIRILLNNEFTRSTELQDGLDQEIDLPTPLMRAVVAGHRDLAVLLIKRGLLWERDRTGQCSHGRNTCPDKERRMCAYGHVSAPELILYRGEVELMEVMMEHGIMKEHELYFPYRNHFRDLPRVLSCANIMEEWLELRSTLYYGLHRTTLLQMQTDLAAKHDGRVPRTRKEMVVHIEKELYKLRAEIIETRESWYGRAKKLEKETGKRAIYPIERVVLPTYGLR